MTTHKELVLELQNAKFVKILPGNEDQPVLVFLEPMTRLIHTIKEKLIEKIQYKSTYKWQEWTFPRIVPERVLAAVGWLTFHREEAWFLGSKTERNYSSDLSPQQSPFKQGLLIPPSPFVLDPIQCASFYHALAGEPISKNELPLTVYEHAGGWTHRLEWDEPDGLFRAYGFRRLELVWLGTSPQSKEITYELLERSKKFLTDEVGLDKVSLYEGDPCFLQKSAPPDIKKPSLPWPENVADLKFPAYDIIVGCEDELYEIASAGRHEKLPSQFDIKCSESIELESGCLGLGLNRIAAVFLRQKGIRDRTKWPKWIWNSVFTNEAY